MNMHVNSSKIKADKVNSVSRRSMFGVAGGSLAAFMIGATAVNAATHDPIPGWYEEWKQKNRKWIDAIDGPEEESAFRDVSELERLICTTQPVSREGAIAQLEYALDDFGEYMCGNVWHDLDNKLFANLLGALKGGLV